jgi:ankyrin repeat protein
LKQAIDAGDMSVIPSFRNRALKSFDVSKQAVDTGRADIIRLLVANGADITALDPNDNTLLHVAATEGHVEVANALIAAGANVNATDKEGRTPLMAALESETLAKSPSLLEKTVSTPIANGANLDARSNDGETLLHLASKAGALALVRTLIDNGAAVNAVNAKGHTPLDHAVLSKNPEMFVLPFEAGARTSGVNKQIEEIAQTLIKHGARADLADKRGQTPIDLARASGKQRAADALESNKDRGSQMGIG